jgi:hypothetical protein
MDFLKNAAAAVSDTVGSAVDTVAAGVAGAVEGPLLKVCEEQIKKHTGRDIKVEIGACPQDWKVWMARTGINSLCNEDTWAFLDDNQWNKRKIELWNERGIDKIILSVEENYDEEDKWITCWPEWETGSKTLKLEFGPRAGNWESDNSWVEPGYKRWWNVGDEIVFGLQLYQLPGKCFYKSDWLDDFEDVDETSIIPNGTKKYNRWFQFRHWIIYWYPEAQWGWNWAYTTKPPKLPDGSLFNLDFVLSCPSLPNFTMPQVRLPSLPNIEMPSMPSVSLPSLPDAPSLSAPSLSMPSLGSLPSMPDRLKRPTGTWACHGFVELTDLKVKADGATVILSNATVTHFWEKDGRIDTEKKDRQRWVLKATTAEQATSWKESLMESGVEEGDTGGCCTA